MCACIQLPKGYDGTPTNTICINVNHIYAATLQGCKVSYYIIYNKIASVGDNEISTMDVYKPFFMDPDLCYLYSSLSRCVHTA